MAGSWGGTNGILRFSTHATPAGFAESSVGVESSFVLVVGPNSAGKSRLLREAARLYLFGAAGFVDIEWVGSKPESARYVDVADLVERQRQSLLGVADLPDLLEQAGFAEFRPAEVREASFLIGRQYQSIRVAEVENPRLEEITDSLAFRPEIVPYFQVQIGTELVDGADLSRGELAALTLIWVLKQPVEGTLLVIDEPDAFLSPTASGRALDYIATATHESRTPVMVSSHSYIGLAQTPPSTRVMVRLDQDGVSHLESGDATALWTVLRVEAPRHIAFVVEDQAAKVLLTRLLSESQFPHYDVTDVWIGGDASNVIALSKVRHGPGFGIRLVGVVDGDMRNDLRANANGFALPGTTDPESVSLEILRDEVAFMPEHRNKIDEVLAASVGVDSHDRLGQVAAAIGMTADQLLIESWMFWIANSEAGIAAFAEFKTWLDRVTPPAR